MNKELYYTPEPEELHIGWEGEACFSSFGGIHIWDLNDESQSKFYPPDPETAKFWSKFKIVAEEDPWIAGGGRDMKCAVMCLKDNRLRCKYLDKFDIEELGWKNIETLEDNNYIGYKGNRNRGLYPEKLEILWWNNWNLRISSNLGGVLFNGKCKNKNELQWIQKRLSIQN